jgi:hypothetical protein
MRKVAALALFASACSTIPADRPAPSGTCSNDGLNAFTGREATSDVGAEIMHMSGANILRWVPNGSVITMEFRADRVTIYLDANNKVERVNCG